MSQKFDELKQKIKNVDKDKAGQLVKEVKEAHSDGKIDKNERDELMDTAKQSFGNIDLGGLGNLGKK
ncbi:hypothetical protein [Marinilactibacillus sp. Marseille-P9653]|uniref:hypothetical protein n=1 Tax=Marinilactibacillus sp. Marseille-P9653 TaxID=2866583 RepID=UPI001CE40D88|nr:hypothetical protein [Marinilactibacillus sp. Marseille-P9653]